MNRKRQPDPNLTTSALLLGYCRKLLRLHAQSFTAVASFVGEKSLLTVKEEWNLDKKQALFTMT